MISTPENMAAEIERVSPTVDSKGAHKSRSRQLTRVLSGLALTIVVLAILRWAGVEVPFLSKAFATFANTFGTFSHIYLPVAGVSVNLLILIGLGFGVGCLSGLFGVGGGFLMTPLLMMIGIPSAPAVASDSCQIVGASSSGAYAHMRMGNVDVKLGLTLLAGGIVGGTAGVQVVAMLRALGNFDCWVKITYVVVLGAIGVLMLRESVSTLIKNWVFSIRQRTLLELVDEGYVELKARLTAPEEVMHRPFRSLTDRLPGQTTFAKAGMQASYIFPFAIGLLVGLLTAVMGVGGGFILIPAMTYILGVNTKIAVGTSLFQMVFTSINVTFQQAVTNATVDAPLAMLLLVGSAIGAQVGARLGRPLKGHQLRIMLGLLVLAVTIKLLLELILPPAVWITLADVEGGH